MNGSPRLLQTHFLHMGEKGEEEEEEHASLKSFPEQSHSGTAMTEFEISSTPLTPGS